VPELHVVADVGVGALFVGNEFIERHGPRWSDDFGTLDFDRNRLVCEEAA
jgi:hypothetical protein